MQSLRSTTRFEVCNWQLGTSYVIYVLSEKCKQIEHMGASHWTQFATDCWLILILRNNLRSFKWSYETLIWLIYMGWRDPDSTEKTWLYWIQHFFNRKYDKKLIFNWRLLLSLLENSPFQSRDLLKMKPKFQTYQK